MALFDKDNPGKNLANATLWLESSEDPGNHGSSGDDEGGCLSGSGCMIVALLFVFVAVLPALLITCTAYMF